MTPKEEPEAGELVCLIPAKTGRYIIEVNTKRGTIRNMGKTDVQVVGKNWLLDLTRRLRHELRDTHDMNVYWFPNVQNRVVPDLLDEAETLLGPDDSKRMWQGD